MGRGWINELRDLARSLKSPCGQWYCIDDVFLKEKLQKKANKVVINKYKDFSIVINISKQHVWGMMSAMVINQNFWQVGGTQRSVSLKNETTIGFVSCILVNIEVQIFGNYGLLIITLILSPILWILAGIQWTNCKAWISNKFHRGPRGCSF